MLRGQRDADATGGSTGIHIVKENTRTPRKIPDMEDEKVKKMTSIHKPPSDLISDHKLTLEISINAKRMMI